MRRFAKKRARRGFTLLETVLAVTLMSLVFLGAMNLFIAVGRTSTSAHAKVFSSQDAANALQRIVEDMREARTLALPGETDPASFRPRPGYSSTGFYTTQAGGQTIHTAVTVTFPDSAAPVMVNFPTGTRTLSDAGGNALYNRRGAGIAFLIYRANTTGVPNSSAGTCLWIYSLHDSGQSVNRALIRSVAAAPNAVRFARPTDGSGAVLPNQMGVKIVSGYHSPVRGAATNEASDGRLVTELSGKCVQVRNR